MISSKYETWKEYETVGTRLTKLDQELYTPKYNRTKGLPMEVRLSGQSTLWVVLLCSDKKQPRQGRDKSENEYTIRKPACYLKHCSMRNGEAECMCSFPFSRGLDYWYGLQNKTEPEEVKLAVPRTHGHCWKREWMGLERVWIGNWVKRGDSDCLEADYSPVKPYINTSLLKVGFHGDHGRGRGCGEDVRFLGQSDAFQVQRKRNGHTPVELWTLLFPQMSSSKIHWRWLQKINRNWEVKVLERWRYD